MPDQKQTIMCFANYQYIQESCAIAKITARCTLSI